ncbi:MAG: hypothetical protein MJB14_12285 [Spirochaetes bacterium]|nr:hypothetical protein [Spirochaetota bacterium]
MKTLEQINEKIQQVEQQLQNVRGTETEVYTRIVGYHRAVTNWNKGKKREYFERTTFNFDKKALKKNAPQTAAVEKKQPQTEETAKIAEMKKQELKDDSIAYYNMFYSQFCHNCPPVKEFMKKLPLNGDDIDVTSDLGLNIAREYDVMSTPAVLLFDKDNKLVQKANSLEELREIFSSIKAYQ